MLNWVISTLLCIVILNWLLWHHFWSNPWFFFNCVYVFYLIIIVVFFVEFAYFSMLMDSEVITQINPDLKEPEIIINPDSKEPEIIINSELLELAIMNTKKPPVAEVLTITAIFSFIISAFEPVSNIIYQFFSTETVQPLAENLIMDPIDQPFVGNLIKNPIVQPFVENLIKDQIVLDPKIVQYFVENLIKDPKIVQYLTENLINDPISKFLVENLIKDPKIVQSFVENFIKDPKTVQSFVENFIKDPIVLDPKIVQSFAEMLIKDPVVQPLAENLIKDPVVQPLAENLIMDPIDQYFVENLIKDPVVQPLVKNLIKDPVASIFAALPTKLAQCILDEFHSAYAPAGSAAELKLKSIPSFLLPGALVPAKILEIPEIANFTILVSNLAADQAAAEVLKIALLKLFWGLGHIAMEIPNSTNPDVISTTITKLNFISKTVSNISFLIHSLKLDIPMPELLLLELAKATYCLNKALLVMPTQEIKVITDFTLALSGLYSSTYKLSILISAPILTASKSALLVSNSLGTEATSAVWFSFHAISVESAASICTRISDMSLLLLELSKNLSKLSPSELAITSEVLQTALNFSELSEVLSKSIKLLSSTVVPVTMVPFYMRVLVLIIFFLVMDKCLAPFQVPLNV